MESLCCVAETCTVLDVNSFHPTGAENCLLFLMSLRKVDLVKE